MGENGSRIRADASSKIAWLILRTNMLQSSSFMKEAAMAELKTKKTEASVEKFLNQIKDEQTRQDCLEISKMMKQATKSEPKMWGSSIIGFGSQLLKYPSGRELDWMIIGF